MGIAGDASMNLRVDRMVFKVGWWGTAESGGFEMFPTSAWDAFGTISLLGGWSFPMGHGGSAVVVHTGVSMATLTRHIPIPGSGFLGFVDFRSVTSSAVGWPVQVGFLAPTRSGSGLTMHLMLDVNAERTMGAFTLGLRLGRMYPR